MQNVRALQQGCVDFWTMTNMDSLTSCQLSTARRFELMVLIHWTNHGGLNGDRL